MGLAVNPGDSLLVGARGQATGETVQGSYAGLDAHRARCRNLSSGQTVTFTVGNGEWDCAAHGFSTAAGDLIQVAVSRVR